MIKNPPVSARDIRNEDLIPELGRSSGEGHGHPLWYSCLENPTDREGWRATVHGVTKESDTTEVTEHACMQKGKRCPASLGESLEARFLR